MKRPEWFHTAFGWLVEHGSYCWCFHLSFNLYPTPQVLVQKVLTKVQLWFQSVLFLPLLFFSLLWPSTLSSSCTPVSLMLKYVQACVCVHVCVWCVHVCIYECVPEGNTTIWLQMDVHDSDYIYSCRFKWLLWQWCRTPLSVQYLQHWNSTYLLL